MSTYDGYIRELRARGQYSFTADQALFALNVSESALYSGVKRLKQKGELASPAKKLYIIVPSEYQSIGCLPAEELIPILMKYWNQKYYVSLLSAAMYHGAAHQKPQVFQVITNKQIKKLNCGKVKIDFIYKKNMENLSLIDHTVKTGYLKLSSPEVTVMDLLLYPINAGGLNNIATVISELTEKLNPELVVSLAIASNEKAWVQRLGFLLENIETFSEVKQKIIVTKLQTYLGEHDLSFVPLTPELPRGGCKRNAKWKIIENTSIESDHDT